MSALPRPPSDISIYEDVREQWSLLEKKVLRGHEVAVDVLQIERAIGDCRKAYAGGTLRRDLDWDFDLELAERLHARHVDWMQRDTRTREDWRSMWLTHVQDSSNLTLNLAQHGIKFILVAHGATAIAALNAVVLEKGDRYRVALLVALFGASVGMAMVALGKIVSIERVGYFNGRVKGHLLRRKGWRSLKALHRYSDRYNSQYGRLANCLIYGSIIWMAVYFFSTLMLIVHS
jgi:hypothetical protein